MPAETDQQSHGLQLIHDPGAHLHPAVAMPQQLPFITISQLGTQILGEVILQNELQNMPRILASALFLAYPLAGSWPGRPSTTRSSVPLKVEERLR